MARISTYPIDQEITGSDKVIGTDHSGDITKNYSLVDISNWMNESGGVTIVGQNNYSYLVPGQTTGTITGPAQNATFASITEMQLSKTASTGGNVINYLLTLVGRPVILARLDNPNNFGVYTLDSLVVDSGNANFYNAAFTLITANGEITANKYYGFAVYPEIGSGGGGDDKHFTFNSPSPASAVWNVTHNLGKFPSVSITTSAGDAIYADIEYIDINSLTITFSYPTGGKAYMN
tara:strand:- start:345 stop:1049 length:705 start_codon:yes stop_codon:yes gene_type:complete